MKQFMFVTWEERREVTETSCRMAWVGRYPFFFHASFSCHPLYSHLYMYKSPKMECCKEIKGSPCWGWFEGTWGAYGLRGGLHPLPLPFGDSAQWGCFGVLSTHPQAHFGMRRYQLLLFFNLRHIPEHLWYIKKSFGAFFSIYLQFHCTRRIIKLYGFESPSGLTVGLT